MLTNEIPPAKTPDLDNLIKFPLDVMNGEVWLDDKQIISILAFKHYAEVPRTEITIHKYGDIGRELELATMGGPHA